MTAIVHTYEQHTNLRYPWKYEPASWLHGSARSMAHNSALLLSCFKPAHNELKINDFIQNMWVCAFKSIWNRKPPEKCSSWLWKRELNMYDYYTSSFVFEVIFRAIWDYLGKSLGVIWGICYIHPLTIIYELSESRTMPLKVVFPYLIIL